MSNMWTRILIPHADLTGEWQRFINNKKLNVKHVDTNPPSFHVDLTGEWQRFIDKKKLNVKHVDTNPHSPCRSDRRMAKVHI